METGLCMEYTAEREFPPIDNGLRAKLLLNGGFLPQEKRIMSGIYYGTGDFARMETGLWVESTAELGFPPVSEGLRG